MFRFGIRNTLRLKHQFASRFSSSSQLGVVGGSREHIDIIENRLFNLFENYGASDYIGEPINIAEHSIQAMLCAKNGGESEEVQMAALLHDVGHLLGLEAGFEPAMDGCGTVDHEGVGADFIRGLGLHDNIAYLTQEHVSAKRYLCNRNPGYEEALSEASKTTLRHQGGAMTDEEAAKAESDPRWQHVLTMRYIDEAAKDPDMKLPPLKDILRPLIEANLAESDGSTKIRPHLLSREQLRAWNENGFLKVKNAIPKEFVSNIGKLTDEMTEKAELISTKQAEANGVLVHHEAVLKEIGSEEEVVRMCRIENFCSSALGASGWSGVCFGVVQDLVGQLYGEEAVLFKDKLNFKGPGGAGFLSHQDATAWATDKLASRHVSAMVSIDPATKENGAVQVARGRHQEGIFENEAGVISPEVDAKIKYEHVLVSPGDLVLFDSYLPHRSDSNTTDTWRRLAYLTFNPASEGDHRVAYYQAKAEVMKSGNISINSDFGGKIVD